MRSSHLLCIGLLTALLVLAPHAGQPTPATAATLNFTVTSTVDAPDATPGDGICATSTGQCTLRAAIQEADALPPGSTLIIIVPSGIYTLTLGTLPLTANSITITGALSSTTTIDGNSSTVFTLSTGVRAELSGVTITGANGYDTGGIVNNGGELTVIASTVSGNFTEYGGGGGILNDSGTLTVIASTISGNAAGRGAAGSGSGGGIANNGTVTVLTSTISGNSADLGYGGGIANSGTATVLNSTLSGNSVTNRPSDNSFGGAIYNNGTLTVVGSALSGNTAYGNCDSFGSCGGAMGGGIDNDTGGTLTVVGSALSGNTAGAGGGIGNQYGATVTVTTSTLGGNTAGTGGGINNGGTLMVLSSTLSSNTASGGCDSFGDCGTAQGGGIYNGGTLTVTTSTLSGNTVTNSPPDNGAGGAIYNSGGPLTVISSTLSSNAAVNGGGIHNGGALLVTNSTLSGNVATNGGGIDNYYFAPVTVTNSTLSSNMAVNGGGLDNSAGIVALSYVSVVSNTTGITTQAGATTAITGTIIASSMGGPNCGGPLSDGGYNLDSGTTCGFSQTTDLTNTNPLLGPLASNGGPTPTQALLPGSPAIDHGGMRATGCPATDQRGVSRPQGTSCDMGAYEAGMSPYLFITPHSGVHGQIVIFAGTNFGSNEIVKLYADSTSNPPLYIAATSATGTFSLINTVRAGIYGGHIIIAVGQSSHLSADAPFQMKPEVELFPAHGVRGATISARGFGFGSKEAVTLHWGSPGGPLLVVTASNALGSFGGSPVVAFKVPAGTAGSYRVYGVGTPSGARTFALFRVT